MEQKVRGELINMIGKILQEIVASSCFMHHVTESK